MFIHWKKGMNIALYAIWIVYEYMNSLKKKLFNLLYNSLKIHSLLSCSAIYRDCTHYFKWPSNSRFTTEPFNYLTDQGWHFLSLLHYLSWINNKINIHLSYLYLWWLGWKGNVEHLSLPSLHGRSLYFNSLWKVKMVTWTW